MKWLLRGMAKRKEILAEIGPRPKYVISPELLQDCLNLTKDTFNTLQSIKQKRKEMDTNTQPFQWSETTALLFAGYYMSKTDQGEADKEKIIADFKERLRPHSTVTEERREGWEVLEYIHPHSGTIVSGTYFSGNTIDEDIRKRYLIRSVKRLVDNSILTLGNDTPKGRISKFEYAHPDGKMYIHYDLGGWDYLSQVEKAPIPEEPKPVLPIVPVYLTQPQIDKLIEMLGGSK